MKHSEWLTGLKSIAPDAFGQMLPPTNFCQEWLDSLLGKNAVEVITEVKSIGEEYQVTKQDGVESVRSLDINPCRLSVEVEAGLITKACFG